MKKFILLSTLYSLLSTLFVGCLVRTYTVEKPRADLEITGNQGYLMGSPSQEVGKGKKRLSPTRKISVLEVELGAHQYGRGLESEGLARQEGMSVSEETILEEPEDFFLDELEDEELFAEKEEYKIYTVQKNDTLQEISRKFYNTTKRWKKLYEANRDVLKSPDKVYPGQVLKIPLD